MLPKPIRLVETPPAPNPRRLRIFLAEKDYRIPSESIDIMADDHRRPEYIAWAGASTVPAVELEDKTVLTETIAIFRYVEALQPEPNLLGRDPLEAAVIEMWNRRIEFGLMQHVAAVVRHTNPRMGVLERGQVAEWGEANRSRVDQALRYLNARLESSSYVAGERFTAADITPHVMIDFMRVARMKVPEELVHLRRWLEEMRARPSASA